MKLRIFQQVIFDIAKKINPEKHWVRFELLTRKTNLLSWEK